MSGDEVSSRGGAREEAREGAASVSVQARLRALPAVDRLAEEVAERAGARRELTRAEAVAVARRVLAQRRAQLLAGAADERDLAAEACELLRPTLRRVLNATGVIVHTNLGRAPLAPAAIEAVDEAARGYSNLEIDLASGRRGSRDVHVKGILCELTGAADALVVNNGAAAALLAIAALGDECGIAVSRGQLVEIGGGFRVPDVLAQAGVPLIEVGTTNRTRLEDYEQALARGAGAILRVHQSNFRTVGFVEDVSIEQLCTLGVPVIDDLGSGMMIAETARCGDDGARALAQVAEMLAQEPSVSRSVRAGVQLACFSGDKLLGGPQAGILVGTAEAVAACRRHPLARAMRIGRLPLAGLAATLAIYRDPERAIEEVPVLSMLSCGVDVLRARAQLLAQASGGNVVESVAKVGGGALPLLELCGPAVALTDPCGDAQALARSLRSGEPALLARICDGQVLIDPRTLLEDEVGLAVEVLARICSP